ncbi:hypothetical protein ABIB25_004276 [Nakamurella sp. UYEF19]|uniref:hypothetical protein n=1 Tax=Nakamurella sp. UYEF19 TaxID=1756392 RepID=UPI0033984C95
MSNGLGNPGNVEPAYLLRYPSQKRDVMITGLVAVVGVVAIVVAPASWQVTNGLWVFVIVLLIDMVITASSGIRCDADGAGRWRGVYMITRLTWSEIQRFEAREGQGVGVLLNGSGGWIRLARQSVFGDAELEAVAQLERQRQLRQSELG